MKRIAVIYKSKYGATKRYAEWIAEELDAELIERSSVNPNGLASYDVVVYGGGLYAGSIAGIDLLTKNPCGRLVVFTVGLTNPEKMDFSDILTKNLGAGYLKNTQAFHLRGGIDYKKLSFTHKAMMAMIKKLVLDKKAPKECSEAEQEMIKTYGGNIDYTDKAAIKPLVSYVLSLV